MSKLTRKEKEFRKILFCFHNAFVKAVNQFRYEDLLKYNIMVNTSSSFSENLFFEYERLLNQCSMVKEEDINKLSIFDKVICIGLSLKRIHPVITNKIKSKTPKKVKYLEAGLISDTMLSYLLYSSYTLKDNKGNMLLQNDFTYEGFLNKKSIFNNLRRELIEVLYEEVFDYFKCINILEKIYGYGVMSFLDLEVDSNDLLTQLKITEKDNYSLQTPDLSDDYTRYLKLKRQK